MRVEFSAVSTKSDLNDKFRFRDTWEPETASVITVCGTAMQHEVEALPNQRHPPGANLAADQQGVAIPKQNTEVPAEPSRAGLYSIRPITPRLFPRAPPIAIAARKSKPEGMPLGFKSFVPKTHAFLTHFSGHNNC